LTKAVVSSRLKTIMHRHFSGVRLGLSQLLLFHCQPNAPSIAWRVGTVEKYVSSCHTELWSAP